ncbi:Receptor-type tyrosine-protein phosphatase T [Holothuria leucospilota]|uniref:protein-tyrosine-phosphatase n=1 Tax=Holothuria leucospilota TaxID=206669 RepID=A0A9Q1C7J2_HOLLE|nr:Receptor-type tyrosine-protein phosphatase T [Holothuria leucospilota]
MNISADEVLVNELRWRNNSYLWNGSNSGTDPNVGVDTFTIGEPVQLYHAGIYECHRQGDRASAKHGLNLLIIRACPYTTWDPPDCEGVCDSCYNGGVCDENTGRCVCAPGFTGENCLIACGGNSYGYDCEQRCGYKGDLKDKCRGFLFCLVHPFGCRCNTGFKGLDCSEECDPNTFGASCLQSCHCLSDQCNRYTGECAGTDASCDLGWTGRNCQECSNGYFGISCNQECHCSSDKCNRESGLCQTGGCLPQWADLFPPYNCQTGLVRATSTRVNALVPVPVNCTLIIGPGGNLSALEFVLSRSLDDLNDENITSNGIDQTGNTVTKLFMVSGVNHDLSLYCQLRDSTDGMVAVLAVNVSVYVLPEFSLPPNITKATSTTMSITWEAWNEIRNKGTPPVISYNLYHKLSQRDDWEEAVTYNHIDGQNEYYAEVENLNPDTLYDFSVAVVREGTNGEGPMSPTLENQKTKCDVPLDGPQDLVTNVAGEKQELVEISWKLPSDDRIRCSSGVLQVNIYYSSTSLTSKEEIKLLVTDSSVRSYKIVNLEVGEEYIFEMTLITEGGESRRSEYVQHFVQHLVQHLVPGRNAGAIVGSTIASSLFLVLVIVVVILWLRRDRKRRGKNHKGEPRKGIVNNACGIELLESSTALQKLPEDEDEAVFANDERPAPIALVELENYIITAALEQQFWMLNDESQFPSDVGAKKENKTKNRYRDIIAYDHSRVVLPEKDDDPHSDYYNANYIKNLKGENDFIASQGPNKASVEDFWRMVWQEKVSNIVMLTNLVEKGKVRCFRYWPNSVGETTVFGTVKVKWQTSDQNANFDVRDYIIIVEEETHPVRNWHFKTWPDKNIPDQPSLLIEFTRRVKTHQKDEKVPLIVHCSAGVGRTGTFIALYSLMDVVERSEKIDVYGFVEQMRKDRISMVQTPEQYKCLHECLFEVYLTGDTAFPFNKLTTFDVKNLGEKLGREFKVCSEFESKCYCIDLCTPVLSKYFELVYLYTVDKKRPYLQSPPKNSSSNYINACSVKSYRKESSFIATQSPLPSTVEDFWRLVFDWKCPLIVMLNQLDENDGTVCKYWPDAGSSQYGHITVELKEEQKGNRYIFRLFEVDHALKQKPIPVKHLQLSSWDEDLWDIYSFIKKIEELRDDFRMVGPTVVHCINGVGRTGVIIAVMSEMERIEAKEKVDVFTTVRQMRASNHNLIQTKEEYTLCHQLLKLVHQRQLTPAYQKRMQKPKISF